MAVIPGAGPFLLRLIWWEADQRKVQEFRLEHARVTVQPPWQDTLDITSLPHPQQMIGLIHPGRLDLTGDVGVVVNRSTLAQRLADAILEGDDVAAYALADDLLESRARPTEFVERALLLLDLQRAYAECERLQARLDDLQSTVTAQVGNEPVIHAVGAPVTWPSGS